VALVNFDQALKQMESVPYSFQSPRPIPPKSPPEITSMVKIAQILRPIRGRIGLAAGWRNEEEMDLANAPSA
jgi:hypothetical protein